jgi:hypothetical protein
MTPVVGLGAGPHIDPQPSVKGPAPNPTNHQTQADAEASRT